MPFGACGHCVPAFQRRALRENRCAWQNSISTFCHSTRFDGEKVHSELCIGKRCRKRTQSYIVPTKIVDRIHSNDTVLVKKAVFQCKMATNRRFWCVLVQKSEMSIALLDRSPIAFAAFPVLKKNIIGLCCSRSAQGCIYLCATHRQRAQSRFVNAMDISLSTQKTHRMALCGHFALE